jgi:hypothetical protein
MFLDLCRILAEYNNARSMVKQRIIWQTGGGYDSCKVCSFFPDVWDGFEDIEETFVCSVIKTTGYSLYMNPEVVP